MAEAATWDVYVMEYARSKNQPWVDLISGMYHEGVMDLPFSFIFAQRCIGTVVQAIFPRRVTFNSFPAVNEALCA